MLATANLNTPRFVGRKQLPTSIGGAMIHVADHTQRHVGQVVTTAKVIKACEARGRHELSLARKFMTASSPQSRPRDSASVHCCSLRCSGSPLAR